MTKEEFATKIGEARELAMAAFRRVQSAATCALDTEFDEMAGDLEDAVGNALLDVIDTLDAAKRKLS